MSVRSYLRLVSRYWLGALLAGILAAVLGAMVVQFTNKPEHTTSLTITMHVTEQGTSPTGEKPAIDQLAASAPALLTSPRVLTPAGKTVDPAMTAEQLKKALDVRTPNQSLVFTASLSGPEERVTAVMNAIGNEFRAAVDDNALPSYAGVKLTVGSIEVTTEPSAASTMGTLTRAMVGVAVGLLVAFLYLFLRTFLDDKIRSPEDLRELTDDAVLTASGLNDMAQLLSQGLPYLSAGPGENVIAVSGIDSEATDLARELASATARSGASVALVDLDLASRPLGNAQGLADVVGQRATLADVVSPADGIDVVVAGGTDAALHAMTVAAFGAMRALSTRNEDPATASRPFAPDRDGFVLGEGSGILVLESAEHALSHNAQILAVLAGSAVTADAYDVARPEPSGAEQERALLLALDRAGLDASAIGHVNAHATSTPAGDVVEAGVLARTVPSAAVSATKSATGHLLGGAGGLEAVLTVMALQERWAPPTLLPAGVDPELARLGLDVVGPQGRALPQLEAAASTSFGFGGHNVALLLTRQ